MLELRNAAGEPLCASDLAGLKAARADVCLAHPAVGLLDGDLLDVGAEDAVGLQMGMADVLTCRRVLAADFTYLGHNRTPCLQTAFTVFYLTQRIAMPREFKTIAYRHAFGEPTIADFSIFHERGCARI